MLAARMTPQAFTATLQRALLAVPALVVAGVGVGWFVLRAPATLCGAQVYGEGVSGRVALRAVLLEESDGRRVPLITPVSLELSDMRGVASVVHLEAHANAEGVVEFNAEVPQFSRGTQPRLSLRSTGDDEAEPLAQLVLDRVGDCSPTPCAGVRVPASEESTVRRGGFVDGEARGEIGLSVGLVQGVLAVPFPGSVVVAATLDEQPLEGARLWIRAGGAEVSAEQPLVTDASGLARLTLTPRGHVVELVLAMLGAAGEAQQARSVLESASALSSLAAESLPAGRWYGVLPVVPGAAVAQIEGGRLRVQSPISRPRLYVDLLERAATEAPEMVARPSVLWRYSVELEREGMSGLVPLPKDLTVQDAFAVVSSEADMRAMALVGWPLSDAGVHQTYDYRAPLMVDGLAQARERAQLAGRRLRRGIVVFGVTGSVLELGLFLALQLCLPSGVLPGSERSVRLGFRLGWVFALCLMLGLLALGTFALW